MDNVKFLVMEMLDQLLVGVGPGEPVFRIEKKIPGRETVYMVGVEGIDMVREGRSVDMNLMPCFGKFLGENLGGGGHPIDTGKVGIGNQSDFQGNPSRRRK